MESALNEIIKAYDASSPLERARTIPAAWYTDRRVYELERRAVFGTTWQLAARVDQVRSAGDYVTGEIAGEPIVVIRGADGELRGFHNVCRHHAAAVLTAAQGHASVLRCPYHGWTYGLDGALRGVPEFEGVCDFDKGANGLVPLAVETWEQFVFVRLERSGPSVREFLREMAPQVAKLGLGTFQHVERREYVLACNWKVFVDNYLDGGYHVPHIHKGLGSVLDYSRYTIENFEHFCLQSSPIEADKGDAATAAVRTGDMAYYYWVYPNFMLNWYEGVMDTNLALPLGVDRTRVIFDFYFTRTDAESGERNRQSIAVGERIQREDIDVCESVQRGLGSRTYDTGRLSVRREAGEHLFHRLLHGDLSRAAGAA